MPQNAVQGRTRQGIKDMGVLKWVIFRNFALFRLPASAASDVGLTLETRLNTLKQPTFDYPTNQLARKGKKLADPKREKNLLTQKGKNFRSKKREKNSTNQLVGKKGKKIDQSAGRKKRENFSDQKGKNLKFLKFFPFLVRMKKGKILNPQVALVIYQTQQMTHNMKKSVLAKALRASARG